MSLSRLLIKITGNDVLAGGVTGAAISALAGFGRGNAAFSIVGLMAAVAVISCFGPVQRLLSRLLKSFADVPAWPRFVLLGIAALIAAHHGGRSALVVMAFLLMAMDGNTFDALY